MERKKYFGGSDAGRLMNGEWLQLWKEKVGEAEPEDLSNVFRVQLGSYTELFHANWIEKYHDLPMRREKFRCHKDYPYIAGHIDRWLTTKDTFIDFKHSNERASPRSVTERYLPQMAHYANIFNRQFCFISTIPGNTEPFLTRVDIPREYMDELLELEIRFWWHVEYNIAPDIVPDARIEKLNKAGKNVKVDGLRFVDMTGSNEWAHNAGILIDTYEARKAHDQAKTELKKLVEDDVGEAEGHGVNIKRDKRGSLRITMNKEAAQ